MSRNKKTWDTLVGFDGNYGIDISKGIWPGSGIQQKGEVGPKGETGQKGNRGLRGPDGPKGQKGDLGPDGPTGAKGDSAYQAALDAGFIGTEAEWIASLKGETGDKGNIGEKGGFDDLTPEQIATFKGEPGEQGEKGEPAGVFEFKGVLANEAEIKAQPGPHESGDIYQADDTDDLYVWDGTEFVLLSEALDVVKGEKGEVGEKGDKGEIGDTGADGQKGDTGEDGEKGDKGDDGLTAYDIAVLEGFPGTQTEWVESLEGQKGETGEKGRDGYSAYELSQQGLDPVDQITEDEWLESLKGQKGENYDPLVLDDYYTKGQTDQVISQLPAPEDSYDRNYMPEANIISAGDSIDLNSLDQTHAAFNVGIVVVEASATVANAPVGAPFIIRNTIVQDLTKARDVDYTVYQEICKIAVDSTQTYSRVAQPANTGFSPWSNTTFLDSDYYNKSETDALVNAIDYTFAQSNGQITLTDKDSSQQTVTLVGVNGIKVSSTVDALLIDGEDLIPTPQFLGLLQDGQDPSTIAGANEANGAYFIYAYTGVTVGTDPDGAACTPGDWCIYSTDKWVFLDISSDPGVVSVSAGGGLLEVDNTDAANPVVELDSSKVVTPPELEDYLEKTTFIAAAAHRTIGDLVDVKISYQRTNFGGSSSYAIMHVNLGDRAIPSGDGERATDIENYKLLISKKTSGGTDSGLAFFNNLNPSADPAQLVRIKDEAGDEAAVRTDTFVSKADRGDYFEIVFTGAGIPLFSSGWDKSVILDIVTEDTADKANLVYDINDKNWKAGKMDDIYLPLTGGTLTGKLQLDRVGSNTDGLIVKGRDAAGDSINLLSVYHNSGSAGNQPDAVNYRGRTDSDTNLINRAALINYSQSNYLKLSGGTLTGTLNGTRLNADGSGSNRVFEGKQDGSTKFWVNATGQVRSEYAVTSSSDNKTLTTKSYVDSVSNSSLPVGTIVMWFGATAPSGWLKCDGSSFNTTTYAALHAHLGSVANYTSGRLPNFQGLYPGGAGTGHNNQLTQGGVAKTNVYHAYKTGKPVNTPRSSSSFPNGSTRTFTATGNTNAYSNGTSRVSIDENWDGITRPPTLSVHFIIKT